MKRHAHYIATLIGKYRAITVTQLGTACQHLCKRSVLYDNLAYLKNRELIQRVSHPTLPRYGYIARPELDQILGRPPEQTLRTLRVTDLSHAFAVTEALFELSRYSYVTAVAHESEISSDDEHLFCPGRRPDGIIQIEREKWKYEIAVEVERTPKGLDRVKEMFTLYRKAISNPKYQCAGVLFVLHPGCKPERYQEERMKLPSDEQGKVLLQTPEGLAELSSQYFGLRSEGSGFNSGLKSGKVRQLSGGGVQYLPMISTNAVF